MQAVGRGTKQISPHELVCFLVDWNLADVTKPIFADVLSSDDLDEDQGARSNRLIFYVGGIISVAS